MPIVTFTSDFGLGDPYVAAVKGVMLDRCPSLQVVDVTHEVRPQAVEQAVFLTAQAWPYFPWGTVHLVVVDPGVGTARRAIAVRGPRGYAVGPDNGVLSAFFPDEARAAASPAVERSHATDAVAVALPAGFEAREIANPGVMRPVLSATFHGRDLFGPAAAWLAAGLPFEKLGPALERVALVPQFAGVSAAGVAHGYVVHIDRFGNLITTIRSVDLPSRAASLEIAGRHATFVRTYGEGQGLVALVGSSGYVEMAFVNGSAAAETGVQIGVLATVLPA